MSAYAHHMVLRRVSSLLGGEPSEFLTVEEAADQLGVSVATVRRRCAAGELGAAKSGKHWIVSAAAIRKVGSRRPRKTESVAPSFDLQVALAHIRGTDLSEAWVPDVLRYQDRLEGEALLVQQAAGRLEGLAFGPATRVSVPKTPFSYRPGVLLELPDRISYQATVALIAPTLDSTVGPEVFSSRLSNGKKYFLEHGTKRFVRFKEAVREYGNESDGEFWVATADISAYFEHVIHNILFEELSALGVSGEPLRCLRAQLSRWALVSGIGLPQGPNASRVLGNFYLGHVDKAMSGAGYVYFRYMDDVRIVAESKPKAVAALREFERLCRARGLTISSAKTSVKTYEHYLKNEDDVDLDDAAYLFKHAPIEVSRKSLKKILRKALSRERINERQARFSIWRLARIRERDTLPQVLQKLEQLAPLASTVAAYLKHFTAKESVQRGITEFMTDPDRSYSSYLRTWIYAAMLEGLALPDDWHDFAAGDAKDRNNPAYLRSIAICVVAKYKRHADLQWIRDELDREHDPLMMRALLVALAYAGSLTKVVANSAVARLPELELTISWLKGRKALPSLLYADQEVRIV